MAQQQTRTRDPVEDTFGRRAGADMGMAPAANTNLPSVLPGRQGDTAINTVDGIITSQRVAIARDYAMIQAKIAILAAASGKRWVYGWEVKNKDGSRDWIEGATVKCTNTVAREWGNCALQTRVFNEGTHWLFISRFTDLETGFNIERAFRQRINQNTGMRDQARAEDIVFQIGQSKANRNVVRDALDDVVAFAVEEAKNSALDKIKKNLPKALEVCQQHIKDLDVDLKRVEQKRGRKIDNWTVPDVAKTMAEINAVEDGMIGADDCWPTEEQRKQETELPQQQGGETNAGSQGHAEPAGGATTEPLGKDAWIIKREGGARVGAYNGNAKVGDTIEVAGVKCEVLEVEEVDRELVVKPVEPKQDKPPAPAAKKAADKPTRSPLFSSEE